MTLVDKELYEATLELMRGRGALSPAHAALACFAEELCGVKVVNVVADMLERPEVRPRLRILAMGVRDMRRALHEDGNHQQEMAWNRQIRQEYLRLTGGEEFPPDAPLDKLFAVITDFQMEMEEEIVRAAVAEGLSPLREKYRKLPLWRVESAFTALYVFFRRRKHVERYTNEGVCAAMVEDYMAYIRRHDEFGLYSERDASVVFDSKQRVDEEFEGNLFYYYR